MTWVTATEFEQWADRRDCQDGLPAVVRRAIHDSGVTVREVDLPAGDSVTRPGLDGHLVVDGESPFVPSGVSVWEIGTSRDMRNKANTDYRKRTDDPVPVDRAQATFVFVTPRRWASDDKRRWLATKRTEEVWRDVRVIDADDLEQWLERAEAAGVWAAERAGFRPVEMLHSVDHEWAGWRARFQPAATQQLVLAGREVEAERLVAALAGEPGAVQTIKAHSPEEARAFVAAALLAAGERELPLLARSIVVGDPGAPLGRLRHLRGRIVLLPDTGPARDHAPALAEAGNHVVLGIGNEGPGGPVAVELPRPAHEEFAAALVGMGLNEREAGQATLACGRSATVLRRRRPSAAFPRPPWADGGAVTTLVPAALAGGWDESREGDQEALGRLAGCGYATWIAALAPWRNVPDPPIRKVGDVWHLTAPVDACALLVPHLTAPALEAFAEAALDVLGEDDPHLDCPPAERPLAELRGNACRHSEWLRTGVARSLLLLGAAPFAGIESAAAEHGQRVVDRIVEGLLARPGWRPWANLDRHLPSLTEAAPEPFLRALERQLEGNGAQAFATVLAEVDGLFGPLARHVGLLWALETLAWKPRFLRRTCLALARLAAVDPGGRHGNRPLASLREVLLPWHPGTNADAAQRRSALDGVLEREPETGWRLLMRLVPRVLDNATGTRKPIWRDFGDARQSAMADDASEHAKREIVERVLDRVGSSPARWGELLAAIDGSFPPGRSGSSRGPAPRLRDPGRPAGSQARRSGSTS